MHTVLKYRWGILICGIILCLIILVMVQVFLRALPGVVFLPVVGLFWVALLLSMWGSLNNRFPEAKATTAEHIADRFLSQIIAFSLGGITAFFFRGTLVYEKELVQSILTVSSVLVGLASVLLGIARFSEYKNDRFSLLIAVLKWRLIGSLFFGLAAMFLSLFWYAKNIDSLVFWAMFCLCVQLGQVLVFPGEDEMSALAQAALRVLRGEEQTLEY